MITAGCDAGTEQTGPACREGSCGADSAATRHLENVRVLLTGGTGFVGRHLLPQLLRAGARVTCLTRASSHTAGLPEGVAVAQADLGSGRGLTEALEGQDVVIHMAALLFGLGWQDYLRANARAAACLAEAIRQADGSAAKRGQPGIQRLVLVSSQAATGPCGTAPGVNDDAVPAPVSAYGWSKTLTEQILGRALGDRMVTLRPPIIYGSGDKGLLPVFKGVMRGVAVSPGFGREFPVSAIHARDMGQAVICACRPDAQGVYHLNDGQAHNMSDFCRVMGQAVDKALHRPPRAVHVIHMPLPIMALTAGLSSAFGIVADALLGRLPASFGGRLRRAPNWNLDKYREARQAGWLSDGSRIRRELGFTPCMSLEAGMAEAVEGYRREGWL
ncbi:NAD(P)-dependent oxidoreductase [Desulfovibrio sp. MES5]|uniref:NAD-dependent epimerase/dehydratase family protein n=1 Tax=Desulfovibrio sp. MES5 TaxID=1899016 RepID=UPI0025B8CB43|nr:NAD(P)-dependent oxidoreductase [Desulfovibrio sp. MES5]